MDFLKTALAELKEKNLYRSLKTIENISGKYFSTEGKKFLHFSSNNYLGLAEHPKLKTAAIKAIEEFGFGAGASRLISGNTKLHDQLEKKIAEFKNKAAAIVFSTGYMANLGIISALLGPEDAVVIDRLIHASIIDACRLSRAKMFVYAHCDLIQLEKVLQRTEKFRRRLVITESIFSMDGDIAPLKEIAELTRRYQALLMVDEAHAVGVWGKNGRGIAEAQGVEDQLDIVMGTLSKALGCLGGYVTGSAELIDFLRNKSRSFIYTTGLPAACAAASLAALEIIETEPQRREGLLVKAKYLRDKLKEAGWDTGNSQTQIIPLIVGEEKKTLQLASFLSEEGIFVPAIRPPTVEAGKARLRISLMSSHTQEDLDRLLELLGKFKKN
ncbi:MAG: 8-amino-7-oxononanoate synthase [Elusimicrobiota bacterium]